MANLVHDDPMALFAEWYEAAGETDLPIKNAVALATASADGEPSVRMVLLKGFDERGFVFYTNLGSPKAKDLADNPRAALCFHWMPLKRQVRVRGAVEPVSEQEADAYFASRPRASRIGAWASKQSQPMEGDMDLHKRVAQYGAKFAVGEVPRPEFWSGFRIRPDTLEFWVDREFRLHERMCYTRTESGTWRRQKLYP